MAPTHFNNVLSVLQLCAWHLLVCDSVGSVGSVNAGVGGTRALSFEQTTYLGNPLAALVALALVLRQRLAHISHTLVRLQAAQRVTRVVRQRGGAAQKQYQGVPNASGIGHRPTFVGSLLHGAARVCH
jgi:hypothetical protein